MFVMFIGLFIESTFSFRNYGLSSVENKAQAVAQTVKHGLTAHMVNGVMENRFFFLEQIKTITEVDDIWITRGDNVIRQYGKGIYEEGPKDDIDRYVINNGTVQKIIDEHLFSKSSFRITIPYIAEKNTLIDCTSCHNVQVGDTLGSISIVINIDDLKEEGIHNILISSGLAFLIMVVVIILVNSIIKPYINIFSSVKETMQKAHKGDYSHRVEITSSLKEANEVAQWINSLLNKLNKTLNEINGKVKLFLHDNRDYNSEPLISVRDAVDRLSDIYKFRKTIELDSALPDVYNRLSIVFQNKFDMTHFNFLEVDTTNKRISTVLERGGLKCDAIGLGCRASLTSSLVNSSQFQNLCPMRQRNSGHYLCIPHSISNDLELVINIESKSEEEHNRIRETLPLIKDYIDTAKPEIFSKKLLKMVEETAQRDPLTGLYNRKYLEESIQTIVSQAKRTNISYGILMCDIDHFKRINDTFGHDVGDTAIRVIAETLRENTRESDSVIRYGGEEFLVLLYNCNVEYVESIAQKIRISFSKKKIDGGGEIFSKTISIGASIFPQHNVSFWKCIKFADIALYKAKETGRNKVVLFEESFLTKKDSKHSN